MAPKKTVPSPPAIYSPTTPIDPDHEAKLKAEARAYALSGSNGSSSSGGKRKTPPSGASSRLSLYPASKNNSQDHNSKPTSLSIYRPEKQYKPSPDGATMTNVPTATSTPANQIFDEDDDDYVRFVKSLGLDDSFFVALENDDEDFHLSDIEEDDDDDDTQLDEEDGSTDAGETKSKTFESTPSLSSPLSSTPAALPDLSDMYKDLEEELGSLLEEDMEAAVQSLMTSKKPTACSPSSAKTTPGSPKTPKTPGGKKQQAKAAAAAAVNGKDSPATPLRDAARQGTTAPASYQQSQQLRRLLTRHYQLLVQQSVLAVRAAHTQKLHKEKSDFLSGETADDLAEILDGAVGMLQDLDQNRKDAIRNSIQLSETNGGNPAAPGRRSLFTESSTPSPQSNTNNNRRLTRAAFSKTLQQGGSGSKRTAFDIPGLVKLNETFSTLDKSVEGGVKGSSNILELGQLEEACKMVLRQAGSHIDDSFVPGARDLSENFCYGKEFFGEDFQPPCTEEQQMFLRKNRNLFTSGEDNLVLRGVNLYGEKQWILIADRYLPDRSINIISQRYSKLCVMLYKAGGIDIDSKGNLKEPPKLESVDDIDNEKVKELNLTKVTPPAILNVHRWSLEEDLSLLKAVPIMGHMWAELGARLLPHRDRGHLRKRYQVLERRVKATVVRSAKGDGNTLKPTKAQVPRKANTPAVPAKPTLVKAASKTTGARSAAKKPAASKSRASSTKTPKVPSKVAPASKVPPMSIEKAAASLDFLRQPRHVPGGAAVNASAQASIKATAKMPVTAPSKLAAKPPVSVPVHHPGKVIPVGKLNPPARKPAPAKRSTPKLPVAKSLTPLKFRMDSHASNDISRIAVEKLVDGTNEEWSQMSRIKKMLDNDDESQAVDAIGNLANIKSPVPSTLSKLPHLELDSNSMSGLSILHDEASRQATDPIDDLKSFSDPGMSIMSRVLEGASKSSDPEKKRSGTKKDAYNEADNMSSPLKRRKVGAMPATPLPSTPKRPPNFFSTDHGTPMLSPTFKSTPMRRDITLTPHLPFSPAPSGMMRFGMDESVGQSMFCDFHISEESKKELEDAPPAQHDPTPPPLTPSKNSLMIGGNLEDLEDVASALAHLSNSPSPFPKKRPDDKKGERKSLFARVVGGDRGKDPTKKLQF